MTSKTEWPLWEVFVRSKAGLDHKHCGSLHAADPQMAIQMARERLLARAAMIRTPELRRGYMERLHEHSRILMRAGEWLA